MLQSPRMRRILCLVAMLGLTQGLLALQEPSKSVWDGVYSDAQAARGQKLFVRSCGGCHRDDASGGDDSEPPLRGPNFTYNWEDASIAALYDFIASNMPRNRPGSLALGECADIVAFVLKLNEMPSGAAELTTNIEQLDQIRFTAKRPPR